VRPTDNRRAAADPLAPQGARRAAPG